MKQVEGRTEKLSLQDTEMRDAPAAVDESDENMSTGSDV